MEANTISAGNQHIFGQMSKKSPGRAPSDPISAGRRWQNEAVAGYTSKNLREVENSAPKFGLAPGLEARFASGALELERSGLSYQRLAPGFRIPFGHRHAQQEEIYLIASGGGRMKLDDEIVELRQWDAVRVSAETTRNFEAGPEGAELIVFGAPGPNATDAEMLPDWWSE